MAQSWRGIFIVQPLYLCCVYVLIRLIGGPSCGYEGSVEATEGCLVGTQWQAA